MLEHKHVTVYGKGSPTDQIATSMELVCRRLLSRGATPDELVAGIVAGCQSVVKDAQYVHAADIRPLLLRRLESNLFRDQATGEDDD